MHIYIGVKSVPNKICREEGDMHVKPNTSFYLHKLEGFDIIEGSVRNGSITLWTHLILVFFATASRPIPPSRTPV